MPYSVFSLYVWRRHVELSMHVLLLFSLDLLSVASNVCFYMYVGIPFFECAIMKVKLCVIEWSKASKDQFDNVCEWMREYFRIVKGHKQYLTQNALALLNVTLDPPCFSRTCFEVSG